jgi:hypothetical protein
MDRLSVQLVARITSGEGCSKKDKYEEERHESPRQDQALG